MTRISVLSSQLAIQPWRNRRRRVLLSTAAVLCAGLTGQPAQADETCQSPYMAKITGEEEFVYVWTLGLEGVGDGQDKVVTVDVRKDSPTFGKAIDTDSVGGRGEAHHGGLTDDRRFFWVAGLSDSKIHIFDVATNPANPKLVKTIDDFVEKSGGVVGAHGAYALPGRMLIPGLSNKNHDGRTGLVEYTNDGQYITTHWMPTAENTQGAAVEKVADGFGGGTTRERKRPRWNVLVRPFTRIRASPEEAPSLMRRRHLMLLLVALLFFAQLPPVYSQADVKPAVNPRFGAVESYYRPDDAVEAGVPHDHPVGRHGPHDELEHHPQHGDVQRVEEGAGQRDVGEDLLVVA